MVTDPIKFVYLVGDGVTTDFSYAYNGTVGFDADVADDVKAAILNPDGTRDTNPNFAVLKDTYGNFTGAIRFATAPVANAVVYIYRATPQTQETEYKTSSGFDAKNVENDFDKLTKLVQETSSHARNKTVQLDMFQEEVLKFILASEANQNQMLFFDFNTLTFRFTSFTKGQAVISSASASDDKTDIMLTHLTDEDTGLPYLAFSLDQGATWKPMNFAEISAIVNSANAKAQEALDNSETAVSVAAAAKAAASATYSKTEVDNALAKKLNVQQGASNAGKILKIGEDGNIIASSEAGGLASVNHDDTLEGAGTDSSPLVIADKEKLTNKITNCILQIPQIDLSIQNGKLVLASRTKVYVANNGVSSLTTSSELTYSTEAGSGQYMIILNGANTITSANLASCSSGTLAQRPTNTPTSTGLYYATDTQTMYSTSNYGSTWNSGTLTLPIAIATVSNGQFTSVTPFNGVGYIGTTLFSVPDLLVSIPNGRSSDGTLNNVTNPQTKVNVYTLESFTRTEIFVGPTQLVAVAPNTYTYDFEQNKVLTATGDQRAIVKIGTVSNDGSTITGIDLDEPFAAVDYNEYVKDLSNINETLEDINETLEDKASISEPQTIGGKYTFTQTIDTNNSLGMQINRSLDSNGTTVWRVYDATNSRQIRGLGFYANSKIYNRLSIVGKTGKEGYLNFSMTDDGTMNIELGGDKEYLPSKGANNASFATTKWVQRELGDYVQNDLSNISSNIDYVVESQEPAVGNGYSWYRKYKSGWCIQGGSERTPEGQTRVIVLHVPMDNNSYQFIQGSIINSVTSGSNANGWAVIRKTTTSFTIGNYTGAENTLDWFICGMAA